MDLWMVAAATGAGYIAKHLQQNLPSGEKDEPSYSLESAPYRRPQSVNVFRLIREQRDPFRRLARRRPYILDDVLGKSFEELLHHQLNDVRESGDAAAGGSHDYNSIYSSDRSGLSAVQEDEHPREFQGSDGYSARRTNRNNGYSKTMPQLYSLQLYGPPNPSESFLVRQPGIEKDGAFRMYHLPHEPAVRPLLVTDGTRVISRPSTDFEMEMKNREELPWTIRPNLSRRSTQILEKARSTRPSVSGNRPPDRSMNSKGSSDGSLFLLGLMIGTMSSVTTSRTELEKLDEKLKQARNLVQDLHEELEMKDQLTVKEIDWKVSSGESSGRNGTPNARSSNGDRHESKPEMEKSEAMSKIEAELEAELERLELNMKTTSLDNMSEFLELDPEFEIDVVRENPSLKKLDAQQPGALSNSDRDTSEDQYDLPQTSDYAVSPRDLTLRLHELIESRLEARILELEAALESTQRRLSSLTASTRRDSMGGELERPWNRGSPSLIDEDHEVDQPFIMDLSGEALGAYNEACEEIGGSSILFNGQTTEEEWTPTSRESSDDGDEELSRRLVEQILRSRGKVQEQVLNASKSTLNGGLDGEETAVARYRLT